MSPPAGGAARRAVVLAGAPIHPSAALVARLRGVARVICADGGLAHAGPLGLRPDLLVGDLDSVSPAALRAYPGVPQRRYPREKGELDLELAVAAAVEQGARELLLVGCLGGRLDQTLAALTIALRLRREGLAVSLHDGFQDVYPMIDGDRISLRLPAGTRFSLLAMGEAGAVVDVTGARYPLEAAALPYGAGLGVSNEAAGGPGVVVRAGPVLLVVGSHEAAAGASAPAEGGGAA